MFSLLDPKKVRVLEPWPFSSPPTIQPFWFEKWDASGWRQWMAHNWPCSLFLAGIYLLLIPLVQKWMETRRAFGSKRVIFQWNLVFAVFSICGFLRTAPELLQVVSGPDGLHRSLCVRDIFNESTTYWAWLLAWSKLVALGNTAILLLRKKEVDLLHRFHHVTLLVFSWALYPDWEPSQRWFLVGNMLTCSILYSYRALRARRIPLPKWGPRLVWAVLIGEIVYGFGLNWYTIKIMDKDRPCAKSEDRQYIFLYGTHLTILACQTFNRAMEWPEIHISFRRPPRRAPAGA